MKPKIKPVKGYCIWSPYQGLLYWTLRLLAKDAKKDFSDNLFERAWKDLYREGYRCVRVVMSADRGKR